MNLDITFELNYFKYLSDLSNRLGFQKVGARCPKQNKKHFIMREKRKKASGSIRSPLYTSPKTSYSFILQ